MALEELVGEMSSRLWDFSEIAIEEHQSAAYLEGVPEEEGFAVESGVAGMPTAFVASWGSGRPIVGVLSEFDALPNIGNSVHPGRAPREDGHPHGLHGHGRALRRSRRLHRVASGAEHRRPNS